LVFACRCGQIKVVRLLLDRGVSVNANPPGSRWTATALRTAAVQGQASVVALLLQRGADPTAGLAFGQQAAEGALFGELAELVGPERAGAVQAMLRSASSTRSGIIATAIGIGTLLIAATAVFGELQSALNVIWKAPVSGSFGAWYLLKSRLLSLSVILVIGFLLLVSLVISAALAVLSDYLDRLLPGLAIILHIVHSTFSFAFTTVLFGMIFKILPDSSVEWKDVWLGAAVAALLFTVGKHQISLYIGSSNMASAYGAAGALIIVLVWVYYSAQILLLGAEFAKAYRDQRRTVR
jgi:membrane protein